MGRDPQRWGNLLERYRDDRPRKLLAIDGGGIRGLISLGMLKELEQKLAQSEGGGANFRLGDYFDYVAGTSTGAIIAAGLARGMSVDELIQFYRDSGRNMFEKSRLFRRLKSFYTADPLRKQLEQVFGAETNLLPEHLRCLLLVVTRNVSTDSPWPISSDPDARYNNPQRDDCNLLIPLWQLVRASTAAPIYFPPEFVKVGKQTFTFVDGGMTAYNDPAFLLYRMATHPAYQLGFKTGERKLLLVSLGTGMADKLGSDGDSNIAVNLAGLPSALMHTIQVDQDINCRTVGRCTYGTHIDRELQDLTCREKSFDCEREEWEQAEQTPVATDLGRAFLYARYNADLSAEGLGELKCGDMDPEKVQKMDGVEQIENLLKIGKAAGRQIDLSHLGPFVSGSGDGRGLAAQPRHVLLPVLERTSAMERDKQLGKDG